MSDGDEFMSEESYEFEFEEDEEGSNISANENEQLYDMENKYYGAKVFKKDDPALAIKELKQVLESPQIEENFDWIFKACKQLIKIYLAQQDYAMATDYVKLLMTYITKVNPNYAEDSVSKILNNAESVGDPYVSQVYETILEHLNGEANSGSFSSKLRLWLKINIHKLNLVVQENNWVTCESLCNEINSKLINASEVIKSTYSLEVIAAEILATFNKQPIDLSKLNQLYKKSLGISSPVTHPRIMGVIHECGAKIQFYRGNYEGARIELYESFKNYDEAGLSTKNRILKYLTLCSLLTENQFNPFESQETQSYTQFPEFSVLIDITQTYHDLDLNKFNHLLLQVENNDNIAKDDIFIHSTNIIREHLRSKILEKLLKTYKRVSLEFLASKLQLSVDDLEKIILQSICNGKLPRAKIDLIDNYVEVNNEKDNPSIISPVLDSNDLINNAACTIALSNVESDDQILQTTHEIPETAPSVLNADTKSAGRKLRSIIKYYHNNDCINRTPCLGILVLHELFVFNAVEFNRSENIQFDDWLSMLRSGIPRAVADELSQKDQVILEQRVGSSLNLQHLTTQNVAQNKELEFEENTDLDQINTLKAWCKTIKHFTQMGSPWTDKNSNRGL